LNFLNAVFLSGLVPKQWFRSRLAKAIFHRLFKSNALLTYKDAEMGLQVYRGQWAALVFNAYEPTTRGLLNSLLKPGMVFVDGGASVGIYTMWGSRLVGESGLVYAIEPHPEVYAILEANIARNRLNNVQALNVALSSTKGEGWLSTSMRPDSHSLLDIESNSGYPVCLLSLDEIIQDGQVDLIKFDLEGSEPIALKGMEGILGRRRRPSMIMEFHADYFKIAGVSPLETLSTLDRHGYELWVLDNWGDRDPVKLDQRAREALLNSDFSYDLLCVPIQ